MKCEIILHCLTNMSDFPSLYDIQNIMFGNDFFLSYTSIIRRTARNTYYRYNLRS